MGQFKTLVMQILQLSDEGLDVAQIATVLQVGRSVVEYTLDLYGNTVLQWRNVVIVDTVEDSVVLLVTWWYKRFL